MAEGSSLTRPPMKFDVFQRVASVFSPRGFYRGNAEWGKSLFPLFVKLIALLNDQQIDIITRHLLLG